MKNTTVVKAVLCLMLVLICAAMLFVPVVDGADEVRAMFLLLTGIAVRDFFGSAQEDKRVEALKQAYDPTPPESYVDGQRR